jgi:hypothetical protein
VLGVDTVTNTSPVQNKLHVRFQVCTAANMKMRAFSDTVLCSLIGIDGRFRGAYCIHYQGYKLVRTASIIRVMNYSLQWWRRQYASPKRRSSPTRLYGAISHKALSFKLHIVMWVCCYVNYIDVLHSRFILVKKNCFNNESTETQGYVSERDQLRPEWRHEKNTLQCNQTALTLAP